MKKKNLIILMLILIAALFVGCRRTTPDTTGTGSAPQSTSPGTSNKRHEPVVTIPSPSDMMPDGTHGPARGKDMGRRRLGPRF